MPNLSGPTLIVILFIVLLLFGAPKLPALARSLGQSMKILKKEVSTDDTGESTQPEASAPATPTVDTPAPASADPAQVDRAQAELEQARAEAAAAKAEAEALRQRAETLSAKNGSSATPPEGDRA